MKKNLFVLENPTLEKNRWLSVLTADFRLIPFLKEFEGIEYINPLNPPTIHLWFDPRYDHEELWLALYEALEVESKLIDTWADALE